MEILIQLTEVRKLKPKSKTLETLNNPPFSLISMATFTIDGFPFGSSSSSSGGFLSSFLLDSMMKEEMKKKAAYKASEDDCDDDKKQHKEAEARFRAMLKDRFGLTMMDPEEGEKLFNLLKKRGGPRVQEDSEGVTVRMEMAGLGKDNVKVTVVDQTLVIKGDENEEMNGHNFTMHLPNHLYKTKEMKAVMKNGVLKVVIPKQKLEERKDAIRVVVED